MAIALTIAGLVGFGLGLLVSGMADPAKVLTFRDVSIEEIAHSELEVPEA